MIYSIIFALCFLSIQAANIKEDKLMPKYRKECLLKSNANENDIMKLKMGTFPPSTPKLKTYALCMLSVMGIWVDNIFFRAPIIDTYPIEKRPEQVQRLNKCLDKKGGELKNGDAYEFVKCFYTKNKINKALL